MNAPLSTIRPPLVALLAAVCLAYGLLLALGSREGFPPGMVTGHVMPYLADKPLGEDGFYMLTVAWNWGSGRGPVYNFDQPTTGFQPLATGLFALVAGACQALGGDRWVFLRVILGLGVLNLLLFGHLLGRMAVILVRDHHLEAPAYALGASWTWFNFTLFRAFTYGLETGLYLTLFLLLVLYVATRPAREDWSWRQATVVGLVGGTTWLARLDFGLILAGFYATVLLLRRARPPKLLWSGALALGVLFPWLLRVHEITGGWLPSSGGAQVEMMGMANAVGRFGALVRAVIDHLTPWAYTLQRPAPSLVAAASLAALGVWLRPWRLSRAAVPGLLPWLPGLGLLLVTYPIFFWATHFYARYAAPLVVFILPLLAAWLAQRTRESPWTYRLAVLALPGCFALWAALSLHGGQVGNSHSVTAGFVHRHLPERVTVGAFQSGVVGFFHPNVMNLDGKMDVRALQYRLRGELERYIDLQGIDVLVDWREGIYGLLDGEYLREHWEPCPLEIPNGRSVCLQRKEIDVSFWKLGTPAPMPRPGRWGRSG